MAYLIWQRKIISRFVGDCIEILSEFHQLFLVFQIFVLFFWHSAQSVQCSEPCSCDRSRGVVVSSVKDPPKTELLPISFAA